MYVFFLVLLVCTGMISLADIIFGLKDLGNGIKLSVQIAKLLFFLSLFFFVSKIGSSKKDEELDK